MLKKIMLLTAIGTGLAGCGGKEETAGAAIPPPISVTPTPTQVIVKVIDGYLQNASVCVDRNSNLSCDIGEYLKDRTNKLGEVLVETTDTKYPLIAEIKGGISIDADTGFAKHSFQMVANPGSTQITPFTTLATLTNLPKEAIAASLNIDVNVLFSDYAKSTSTSAKVAGLVARSLSGSMRKLSDNTPQALLDTAIELSNFVAKSNIANHSVVTVVRGKTSYELRPIDANMRSVLTGKSEWTFANLDRTTFAEENFRIARFSDNKVSFYNEWDNHTGTENISYAIDGVLDSAGKTYREHFIYVSDELMIGQADAKANDLNFWLPGFKGVKKIGWTPMRIPAERFRNGETWYHIFDEGKDLKLSAMTFNSDGSVTIKNPKSNETVIGSYKYLDQIGNPLSIDLGNGTSFVIEGWHGNNDILLVHHINTKNFAVFTQDSGLANTILGK